MHDTFTALAGGARLRVLVTGPSGSGKTHTVQALRERGLPVVDADTVEGLSGWVDEDGRRVPFPAQPDGLFFARHRFRWEREVLERFLGERPRILLFGTAANVFEMAGLFDRVFFLRASREQLAARLRSPERTNRMGSTEYQLRYCLYGARVQEQEARRLGIPMLDAERPPVQIWTELERRLAPA